MHPVRKRLPREHADPPSLPPRPSHRFKFFCEAAMEYLKRLPRRPDIVHCHDWPTASIAWADRGAMRCVFTIHNLSYGMDLVGRAMARCEVATTVSARGAGV